MEKKAVIIAHRQQGYDYWEGYVERLDSEIGEWVDYYRSLGHIVKVFPSMIEYRADCEKLLDSWEVVYSSREELMQPC